MIRPGPRNLISDVDGIRVGNAEHHAARTGVTLVLPEERVVAAADVRGGAPGTREIALLDPACLVDRVDAICLGGGSVFGLAAADGAVAWLAGHERGLEMAARRIPIVPGAIIFDLASGGDKDWDGEPPYRRLGFEAAANAAATFPLGNVGAGLGARAGRLKGGLGSVSAVDEQGLQVGALAVANPVGSVVIPGTGCFWAWALEQDGEFGGGPPPSRRPAMDGELPAESRLAAHTTIAVVATNAALDKAMAQRIAIMAHDGMARAIRPVHTPFDGDTIFVLSTGRLALPEPAAPALARIGMVAADCVARAIARAVYAAEDLGDIPCYRTVHAGSAAGVLER